MPWLLNEDRAIKKKLTGLTVTDANAPSPGSREVMVRFRLPETELADETFPLIVIDGPAISKASDREHRGPTILPYAPEGQPRSVTVPSADGSVLWDTTTDWDVPLDVTLSPYKVQDFPIPYNLDYQVTVHTRKESHLTALIASLALLDRIPHRFGYLQIPEDGTTRTLDLLGGPEIERDKDRDDKRIFRAVYSLRVVSELDLYGTTPITNYVETVDTEMISIDITLA